MKKPKMILFDYGHTLASEDDWCLSRGAEEILRLAGRDDIDPAALLARMEERIDEGGKMGEQIRYDVPYMVPILTACREMGIVLENVPIPELTDRILRAVTEGAVMPHADKMLDAVNAHGIRTAVVSNNGWPGDTMKRRLDRLLPMNRFEFVLCSTDCLYQKPDPRIFRTALGRAGLAPEETFYCGDNIHCDVCGPHEVGMFPVFLQNFADEEYYNCHHLLDRDLDFPHLHITDWREFIAFLDTLE